MNHPSPDPDPRTSPGLEPGGGVPPGETPPAEGSTSEAGPWVPPPAPRRGHDGTLLAVILLAVVLLAVVIVVFLVA